MQRFFAPGRTELAGNHTDHQLGRVLAASVDVGITARATRRRDRRVCIHSKGYRPFTVALDDLAVDPRAYGKPWALVRGMAAAILDAGGAVGGFEAWASSALKPGGGLSSSAAFEILVGRIFNALYNGGAFSPEQLARFGQQAENRHFGKPSGLMDQLACALDGVGAWRVHGGGFAGCVQALMPRDAFFAYRKGMEALFGPNSCRELHITRAK